MLPLCESWRWGRLWAIISWCPKCTTSSSSPSRWLSQHWIALCCIGIKIWFHRSQDAVQNVNKSRQTKELHKVFLSSCSNIFYTIMCFSKWWNDDPPFVLVILSPVSTTSPIFCCSFPNLFEICCCHQIHNKDIFTKIKWSWWGKTLNIFISGVFQKGFASYHYLFYSCFMQRPHFFRINFSILNYWLFQPQNVLLCYTPPVFCVCFILCRVTGLIYHLCSMNYRNILWFDKANRYRN